MRNIYFPDEQITENDVFYVCSLIERIARSIHQQNAYVVNSIGTEGIYHLLSVASVLHCDNQARVVQDCIRQYKLVEGTFDITHVNTELCPRIPTVLEIGKVYCRLVADTLLPNEDYAQGIIRVYNHDICKIIDNYNSSAYYEPSYYIARAYHQGF